MMPSRVGHQQRKSVKSLVRRLLPLEFQPPHQLLRRILVRLGYFRARTWLGAHGIDVPDIELYQPLFSPWEGLAEFDRLYHPASHHTLVSRDRCYILTQTLRQAMTLQGIAMECGVFRGGTALLHAMTIAESGKLRPLHLFDSFEGMPQTTTGVDRFQKGDFSSTSAEKVAALMAPYPFTTIHVGFIPQSFQGFDPGPIAWAHVDVDIYQAVKDSIEFIYPRLVRGGFLVFDDYGFPSCPGARRAVDEAFADRPEVPICLPTGQALVVKL